MPVYYFDVSKKGKDLLGTRDVLMLENENAVIENINNLLQTQPDSELMNPDKGIFLDKYLFEPVDDLTAISMKEDIEIGLNKFEKRIKNVVVRVEPYEEENTFIITLDFTITFSNSNQQIVLDFRKIR